MRVIVLQMGKVGSWTIVRSFQDALPSMILLNLKDTSAEGSWIAHEHSIAQTKSWLSANGSIEVAIVSAVRDLLSNSISAFFQNIDNPSPGSIQRSFYIGDKEKVLETPTEYLIEHFVREVAIPSIKRADQYILDFGEALAIDAFKVKFSERGLAFGQYAQGLYAVMHSHHLETGLEDLGNLIGYTLKVAESLNLASDKWYFDKYNEFINTIVVKSEILDAFYSSRFSRSLFSTDDLQKFRSRWE